jgi:hypothetical protein
MLTVRGPGTAVRCEEEVYNNCLWSVIFSAPQMAIRRTQK